MERHVNSRYTKLGTAKHKKQVSVANESVALRSGIKDLEKINCSIAYVEVFVGYDVGVLVWVCEDASGGANQCNT